MGAVGKGSQAMARADWLAVDGEDIALAAVAVRSRLGRLPDVGGLLGSNLLADLVIPAMCVLSRNDVPKASSFDV